MKDVIKKEILYDLNKVLEILKTREEHDIEELKELSDHSIEDVAVHKDLDLISVSVFVYSLYKILGSLNPQDLEEIMKLVDNAKESLEKNNLKRYNYCIKSLFDQIKKSHAPVKEHLQDVMQAARIKKGAVLLQKGLSIGQAAGLMGLSNWDLQEYAGKTTFSEQHREKMPVIKRVKTALEIFGVK